MKKGLFTVLFVCLFTVIGFSQWVYQGAWPDSNYKGGTHGIAVSPDGKVWTAAYNKTSWTPPGSTTAISVTPILVFNANGSFVDTIYTVTSGSTTDTLTGNCRGMGVAADGNILYVQSGTNKILKINYQTRQGMARHDIASTEIGTSPTGPSASSDGTIYVGPVVGSATTNIATYDTDLNYLGSAVTNGPANIARTMEVAPNGLSIYWTMFTGNQGIDIYTRPDELSSFVLTDSTLRGMSIETSAWNPATGLLWVSNDARGTGPFTDLTWYGYNVTTKAIVDSFTMPDPLPGGADKLPRGLDFSPDGGVAYVGLFGTAYPRIYKFSKVSGINDEGLVVVNGYKLSQNYPNPFNPSTKISFELPMSGYTTLKVYDMLGSEVAVLIDKELNSGSHSVNFNAANLSSGTYIYQLNVNGTRITSKMLLLK
jgi:hypothetical protein